MAERLNNLAHAQSLSSTTMHHPSMPPLHNFNPRSVSFDIRSPEELAAVNDFLITLGRDVTSTSASRNVHDGADYVSSPSYFDNTGLAQLGLAGMPGVPSVPGSGASYHGEAGYGSAASLANHLPNPYPSRASHQSVQSIAQYNNGGMYPSVSAMSNEFAAASSFVPQRRLSLSPGRDFYQPTPTHFLSPTHDPTAGASPLSSHSSLSTPPNATPPHLSESLASFDFMRHRSGLPPAVQLAPVDFSDRTMRTIVPLRAAGARDATTRTPPEPIQPRWNSNGPARGPPAKLTSSLSTSSTSSTSSSSSSADPLYPLLTSGDAQFKLAPLKQHRSPSPPASISSPLSRASTISPPPQDDDEDSRSRSTTPSPPTLPPLRALSRYTEDRLAREVGRIALSRKEIAPTQQRSDHARLIRDMLITINTEYRRRHGTPPPVTSSAEKTMWRRESRDVEMVTA